jgi:plastocyanin domain-containing protein
MILHHSLRISGPTQQKIHPCQHDDIQSQILSLSFHIEANLPSLDGCQITKSHKSLRNINNLCGNKLNYSNKVASSEACV